MPPQRSKSTLDLALVGFGSVGHRNYILLRSPTVANCLLFFTCCRDRSGLLTLSENYIELRMILNLEYVSHIVSESRVAIFWVDVVCNHTWWSGLVFSLSNVSSCDLMFVYFVTVVFQTQMFQSCDHLRVTGNYWPNGSASLDTFMETTYISQ